MTINLEIYDPSGCGPDHNRIRKIVGMTLEAAGFRLDAEKKIVVSVAFVPPTEIRRLNRVYRGIDKVTDILSFSSYSSRRAIAAFRGKELELGELVLCCAYIAKSAKMHGVEEEREIAYVLSHGILHLLGWRHGRPMFAVQDHVLERVSKNKPIWIRHKGKSGK